MRSAATAAAGEVAALAAWAAGGGESEDDGDSPASELCLPRPPLLGVPPSLPILAHSTSP